MSFNYFFWFGLEFVGEMGSRDSKPLTFINL